MACTEFSASSELSDKPSIYEERSDLHSIRKPDKPNEAWFHFTPQLTPLSYVMMLFCDTGTRKSTKTRPLLTKNNPFGLLPNFNWSKIHAWVSMAQSLRLISDGNTLPAAQIASEWWLSLTPSNHASHSLAEKIYYKLWNVSPMFLTHMTSRGEKWKQEIII